LYLIFSRKKSIIEREAGGAKLCFAERTYRYGENLGEGEKNNKGKTVIY
jgi:hypothetical protein